MVDIAKLTPKEKKELFIRLADEMAGAARAHDAHSFEQMIHCRQQIVDMIQEWADEAEANKATIESVKAALDRLRV
jgi:hypothetical protein